MKPWDKLFVGPRQPTFVILKFDSNIIFIFGSTVHTYFKSIYTEKFTSPISARYHTGIL